MNIVQNESKEEETMFISKFWWLMILGNPVVINRRANV